jgi:hypothetical protein
MRNIRNVLAGAALSALAGAGAAPAFGANLVTNGGFEEVTGNTNPSFFLSDTPDAGDVTGWTTMSNSDSNNILFHSPTDVAIRHDNAQFGFWSSSGVIASPGGGGNFVAFDGDPVGGAQQSMMQTISGLTVGETYTLTFQWAATQFEFVNGSLFGCPGCWTKPTTNEMQVTLGDSAPQDTETANVGSKGFVGWMPETFKFTADAASEVLKFISIGAPSGQPPVALLDDVSLTGDASISPTGAVPEPGTWAMMGVGFAALGLAAYRRRRKALAIG